MLKVITFLNTWMICKCNLEMAPWKILLYVFIRDIARVEIQSYSQIGGMVWEAMRVTVPCPCSARLADFHLQAQLRHSEQIKTDFRIPRGWEAFLNLDPGCNALSLVPGPQVTQLTPRYLVSHLAHKRCSVYSNDLLFPVSSFFLLWVLVKRSWLLLWPWFWVPVTHSLMFWEDWVSGLSWPEFQAWVFPQCLPIHPPRVYTILQGWSSRLISVMKSLFLSSSPNFLKDQELAFLLTLLSRNLDHRLWVFLRNICLGIYCWPVWPWVSSAQKFCGVVLSLTLGLNICLSKDSALLISGQHPWRPNSTLPLAPEARPGSSACLTLKGRG